MAANAPPSIFLRPETGRSRAATDFLMLSIILGMLPVSSGILFRSYGFGMQSIWLESLRMLDFPDILAEIMIILWARHRGLVVGHYWRVLPQYLKVAVATFVATFWIGAVFNSPIALLSIIRSSYWIIHLAFGLAVYHIIQTAQTTSSIHIRCFVNWQIVGITLVTLITALHLSHLANLPVSYADQIKWSGAVPGCMSVRHFGIFAGSVAALYAGYFFWTTPHRFNIVASISVCTLLTGLIFWSGTRAAATGFVGAFFMLTVSVRTMPPVAKLWAMLLSTVLAVILFAQLLPPDPSFGLFRLFYTDQNVDLDSLSSGRIAIWRFVWGLFLDQPAFGWGEGAMHGIEIADTGLRHIQPHNAILQFLYSWGIIAAGAMVVIIGSVMFRLHQKVAVNFALAGPLMMADALLIMSLFDGTLFFARMIMPLTFCLALCLALENRAVEHAGPVS